jgi:hypothetical protein
MEIMNPRGHSVAAAVKGDTEQMVQQEMPIGNENSVTLNWVSVLKKRRYRRSGHKFIAIFYNRDTRAIISERKNVRRDGYCRIPELGQETGCSVDRAKRA